MKFMIYLVLILAPILAQAKECSWDNPGVNPYTGTATQALAHYTMPPDVRAQLIKKIEAKQYDDEVEIRNKEIYGRHRYANLRNMHFGKGAMCEKVTRHWPREHGETARVYTVGTYSILIPSVCGNVSQVDMLGGPSGATGGAPMLMATLPPPQESAGSGALPDPLVSPSDERRTIQSVVLTDPAEPSLVATSTTSGVVQSIAAPAILYGGGLIGNVGSVSPVPEPPTWALALIGMVAVGYYRWKRNRK